MAAALNPSDPHPEEQLGPVIEPDTQELLPKDPADGML